MKENTKVVEQVKRWLEENGYNYDVKTYINGETACDDGKRTEIPFQFPLR